MLCIRRPLPPHAFHFRSRQQHISFRSDGFATSFFRKAHDLLAGPLARGEVTSREALLRVIDLVNGVFDFGVRVEVGKGAVLEVSGGQILSKTHHGGGGGAGGAIWQAGSGSVCSYEMAATKKHERNETRTYFLMSCQVCSSLRASVHMAGASHHYITLPVEESSDYSSDAGFENYRYFVGTQ
ncbi:hypothetical protein AC579_9851 [Pseudocercospora musae]|uniref:Uncharacterized protein n=1 Tax=Pseudocercospora musae TaxID=113226 RepID=A0A139I805_9PEZI|nr:hypothetical protein AC579_9851 [Pseudocercospora musae]